MHALGRFFYRYRNVVFIFFYAALFIPAWPIFSKSVSGEHYYLYPIQIGLTVTVSGQLLRMATIGLAYIIRGGKDGRAHAEELVTTGMFNHCRNPLYVGNLLMLAGVGIMANSLLYITIIIPLFIFIYYTIILEEERFLRNMFGKEFDDYCQRVHRWGISFRDIRKTFGSMPFNWQRYLIREYSTLALWLIGITLVILINYPGFTGNDHVYRNWLAIEIIAWIMLAYLAIRYCKKKGILRDPGAGR